MAGTGRIVSPSGRRRYNGWWSECHRQRTYSAERTEITNSAGRAERENLFGVDTVILFRVTRGKPETLDQFDGALPKEYEEILEREILSGMN